MSKRQGPPKHQNRFAWRPKAGHKINETEVGGKLRPYSQITGVCARCKEQIDWKRRYGKYKPLTEAAKCQRCSKRAVRQAYHSLCSACAKEQNVCAKCCCCVNHIIARDSAELGAEQKLLEEAIKNAGERDRRTLLRAMNKSKPKNSAKTPINDGNKVGDLFLTASLEDYASKGRDHGQCAHVHEEEEDDDGDQEGGGGVDDGDVDDDDDEDNTENEAEYGDEDSEKAKDDR
uniref:Uncharacterized protein MANES_02G057800 n=1 Tax=Rhizophora mucronata TaxID=61149 RepID=A0A2P2M478_RHIMU